MCMYNLSLDDELVQRTRRSFANETDMTAWLQRQVEALLIEYNTTQQTVKNVRKLAGRLQQKLWASLKFPIIGAQKQKHKHK